MPYVFALLVLLNVVTFGYFVLLHDDNASVEKSVAQAESQITQPVSFTNTSKNVPPLVGTKK